MSSVASLSSSQFDAISDWLLHERVHSTPLPSWLIVKLWWWNAALRSGLISRRDLKQNVLFAGLSPSSSYGRGCRPVVAERDAEALVREVAIKVRRRVLEPVVLPHLGFKMSGVNRHSRINFLGQIDDPLQRRCLS